MNSSLNRRAFLKQTSIAGAGILAGTSAMAAAARNRAPGDKLNCVQIGCGGRGFGSHVKWYVKESGENLVAIVEPDVKNQNAVKKWLQENGQDPAKLQVFTDYRRMFDKIGKSIDAVFIATPNHHHALPAMLAMNLGLAVFCEKPLTHDIHEARTLRKMAAESKRPAQMGNQGHNEEGYRRLCEFIWGGVIGNIKETHSWTDRANGGEGPRPPSKPAPKGMDWDSWIGPAPHRDFHEDLHPHEWHGWFDFGNGSLGNLGCHVLDGVFWALKIEHPASLELEEVRGGSSERYPKGCRVRWDIPARGEMPPVKCYWYEGFNQKVELPPEGQGKGKGGKNDPAMGSDRNLPPLALELMKQYKDEIEFIDRPDSGTLYVGEKGIIHTGTYGGKMHVVPMDKMDDIKEPPKTLPRPKSVMVEFLEACREGKKETSASFDYGARLTEFVLLGNLAQHAGLHKKVEWDGPGMQVKNMPELNQWLKRPYRKGWTA
jgi:predicted dehydrogenase